MAGLPDADEWSVAGALEEDAGVPVDVVILERAPESFRTTLEQIGERLDVSDP